MAPDNSTHMMVDVLRFLKAKADTQVSTASRAAGTRSSCSMHRDSTCPWRERGSA